MKNPNIASATNQALLRNARTDSEIHELFQQYGVYLYARHLAGIEITFPGEDGELLHRLFAFCPTFEPTSIPPGKAISG